MIEKTNHSVQDWLPFYEILDNGVIKLKNNEYIKIIKVTPINFNLKSNLEKEAILNSYKILLKTCNFNIQILIQSNKENLSKHISKIININQSQEKILEYSKNYIDYIQNLNQEKKSSSKNFYIIIKKSQEQNLKENCDDSILINNLTEEYFIIKECLSRCGNLATSVDTKYEAEKILESFFNIRKIINKRSLNENK